MLEAIQVAIERVDADDLTSLADARSSVLEAVRLAHSPMTDNVTKDSIAHGAMEEERSAMLQFVADRSEEELTHVEPLPYRHIVPDTLGQEQWLRLAQAWGIDVKSSYWYPLSETIRSDLVAFDAGYFARDVRPEQLQALLGNGGETRVWEFREFGLTARLDLALLEPTYTGEEGYWSNSGVDWILYASHESSLAVGGSLLPEVKRIWPNWRQFVWTGAR